MAEREQKRRPAPRREKDAGVNDLGVSASAPQAGEKIKADLDELLDEIDEVLETNAEEFVKSYIQKGGE